MKSNSPCPSIHFSFRGKGLAGRLTVAFLTCVQPVGTCVTVVISSPQAGQNMRNFNNFPLSASLWPSTKYVTQHFGTKHANIASNFSFPFAFNALRHLRDIYQHFGTKQEKIACAQRLLAAQRLSASLGGQKARANPE
jgi:hypothetical protein